MRTATVLCFCSLASAALAAPAQTHWVLQAPTVKPATAPSDWSYDATSTTVRHSDASGSLSELGWTRLPAEMTSDGFFLTMMARAKSTKGSRVAGTIAVSATGFTHDKTPGAMKVEAASVDGQPAEVSKTVKLTPRLDASTLTVRIDSGRIRHTYTYLPQ
jgi:hypothetical protein